MSVHPEPVERLIEALASLPRIGRGSAEIIAYRLLSSSAEEVSALAEAISGAKEKVGLCSACGALTEKDPCRVCSDARRDRTIICVVELPRDIPPIEKSGSYRGLYHVLMGRIAPLDGVGPEDLRAQALAERVNAGGVKEVIFALNPSVEGDATCLYLRKLLAPSKVRLTMLARGVSRGMEIQFSPASVIGEALDNRREV